MASKRQLRVESLETRQLLAADILDLPALESSDVELISLTGSNSIASPAVDLSHVIGGPINILGSSTPDFIHEDGNRVVVVDSSYRSNYQSLLHTFERSADGQLQLLKTVDPGFHVEQMVIVGDSAVLLGTQWDHGGPSILLDSKIDPATGQIPDRLSIAPLDYEVLTIASTIPLSGDADPVRQEFSGSLKEVSVEGDNLFLVTQSHPFHIAQIYPPAPIADTLHWLQVSDGELVTAATQSIHADGVSIEGDTILTWGTRSTPINYLVAPGPDAPLFSHQALITEYQINDGSIEKVDDLSFEGGYFDSVELVDDASTAIVVRSAAGPESAVGTSIEIVDLSGDNLEIIDTITLREFVGNTFEIGDDFVLLHDYSTPNELVVVDTKRNDDPSIDTQRVRRVSIGDDLELAPGSIQLSGGQVVLIANRFAEVEPTDALRDISIPWRPIQETVLLTLSTREAEIRARSELEGIGHPFGLFSLIDAETDRFGFFSSQSDAAGVHNGFVFGRLSEQGEFVDDGVIEGVYVSDELDLDANRVIARGNGKLQEFAWETPGEPINSLPLFDPNLPPIEAVDDSFTVESPESDGVLQVLANDQLPSFHRVEIVELIGAPEGSEIIGRAIRLPAEALVDGETLRFEYVISDGVSTSRATVEVNVDLVSQDEIDALVQIVRETAAADFGVSVDEVAITFVEQLTSGILNEEDLSAVGVTDPGLLITLTVPDASALYFISFDAMQPIKIFSSGREFTVEVGLRAVNDDGEQVTTLSEGQDFWLEFTAKDLRAFGTGVFAAFTDLQLPDNIELTEEVEFLNGFSRLQSTGSISSTEIDEFGGYHSPFTPPGGAETQTVFRMRATAKTEGTVTLRPDPTDLRGSEILVYGDDTPIDASMVRFQSLELTITADDPIAQRDVNEDGVVTAIDALQVLNLLNELGNGTLQDLATRMAEGESDTTNPLARFDTNGDNFLAPIDALIVINWINNTPDSQPLAESSVASGAELAIDLSVFEDDDEE